jgi:hypothetical protein
MRTFGELRDWIRFELGPCSCIGVGVGWIVVLSEQGHATNLLERPGAPSASWEVGRSF